MTGARSERVEVIPVRGMAEVEPGDNLATLVVAAIEGNGEALRPADVVVVTQKVVSKAEGRLVRLSTVEPSPFACAWAERWGKDARQVELVLRESRRIVRMERGVMISETHHGFVCANAGIDASNVQADVVALLPADPDTSAERLRQAFEKRAGGPIGVVVSDTFGRPWREGQANVAIGVAGIAPIRQFVGERDPAGYELRVTAIATADELAGAAELAMGKLDRVPVAIIRGVSYALGEGSSRDLVRTPEMDLFR